MRLPRTNHQHSTTWPWPALAGATESLRVLQTLIDESNALPFHQPLGGQDWNQNSSNSAHITFNGRLNLSPGLEPIAQTVANDPNLLKYPSPESLCQDMPIGISKGPIPVGPPMMMVPPNYMMTPPIPPWQGASGGGGGGSMSGGYAEYQNPYLMLKSPPIVISSKDPTAYYGIAALEFNHPYVQNQFSVATQASLFKPLMAAVSVIRQNYQASLGRAMPDDQWLAIFTDCGSRITSRVLKIISRLYAAAAKGDPDRCHDLILLLAEDGLVKGSESRIARPVTVEAADGRKLTWTQLVGHMALSINRLLTEAEPPAAPQVGINGTLPPDFS